MANRRAALYKRVKLEGKWKVGRVVVSPKGRYSSELIWLKGRVLNVGKGVYFVSWYEGARKVRKPCGSSLTDAHIELERIEARLRAEANGVEVKAPDPKRLRLQAAADHFLDGYKHSPKRTRAVHNLTLTGFQESCAKKYLDQIEERDLLRYVHKLRTDGLSSRTVSNRYLTLRTFLKATGVTRQLPPRQRPRFVESEPETYSVADLSKLFSVCNSDQELLFEFFLKTGFRMQETMFVEWRDIDFQHQTVRVKSKPSRAFIPKAYEEREIPLEQSLGAALLLCKTRRSAKPDDLVFPTKSQRANGKMLQSLKRIAKRAGMDEEDWWLHKFRATFATLHLQAGVDVRTLQQWLGHKDLASTMRYLKPARGEQARQRFNATFAEFWKGS